MNKLTSITRRDIFDILEIGVGEEESESNEEE